MKHKMRLKISPAESHKNERNGRRESGELLLQSALHNGTQISDRQQLSVVFGG